MITSQLLPSAKGRGPPLNLKRRKIEKVYRMHSWFFYLFVCVYFAHEIFETYLSVINNRYIRAHQQEIPLYFKDKIDFETYQKSIAYNLEKSKFSLMMRWLGLAITWGVILSGFFALLGTYLERFVSPSSLTYSVLYCLSIGFLGMILGIPSSLYNQFVIEEKYGFNKMTAKLFVMDLLKGLLLSALLGIPLMYLVFWLYQVSGAYWWLWAFLAFFGFQLFLAAVYPTFLAPLFNKFVPLEEGSLKKAIEEIAEKIKFKMSGIFKIDGSKRSSHSNAYFAGIGKFRRIVLFDTLMTQMNEEEIISVLAHEMGHNKKRHIQKQLILGFVSGLLSFWLLSLVMNWLPFYQAFGAGNPSPGKALVLFALFGGSFSFFLTPLSNYLSRKYEYEADAFSVEATQKTEPMKTALVKLSKENLSNLTPHPLYSFYYYSHPTTLERVEAIQKI